MPGVWAYVLPVVMLAGSNVVMNFAWYGHLKTNERALWLAILLSWGLAFIEYCLVVPATRLGSTVYSLPQLKTIQVTMSVATFLAISWAFWGERPSLAQVGGFALIVTGATLVFTGK